MSKKNKIVYSDIQPNAKEAGVWVNTTDGNVKVEKDGKWVDDGGNGGNTESSTIEYLDVSGLDVANKESVWSTLGLYSISVALKVSGYISYSPSSMYSALLGAPSDMNIVAIAIDFNLPTNAFGFEIMTTKEYILSQKSSDGSQITQEQLDAIPRITKEQFYSLES